MRHAHGDDSFAAQRAPHDSNGATLCDKRRLAYDCNGQRDPMRNQQHSSSHVFLDNLDEEARKEYDEEEKEEDVCMNKLPRPNYSPPRINGSPTRPNYSPFSVEEEEGVQTRDQRVDQSRNEGAAKAYIINWQRDPRFKFYTDAEAYVDAVVNDPIQQQMIQ
jgi:hypothetical protein